MANLHGIDLIFGDEVEGWMACLASLLPSSSFFFVYSSFILAFFLLLILLWSVFNFWLCACVFGREFREQNERRLVFLLLKSFFLSLSFLVLAETNTWWGGFVFYFSFLLLVLLPFSTLHLMPINSCLGGIAKPWAKQVVLLTFCEAMLAPKWFSLSFYSTLAGQIKWKWGPLGSIFTT